MKRKNLRILITVASIPFVLVGFLWLVFFIMDVSSGQYAFRRSFKTIELGMKEEEVIRLLGKPNKRSTEFHLGQYEGFEEDYERAEQSNSKYYLFWYWSIDMVYTIGFGSDGQVTIAAYGGT